MTDTTQPPVRAWPVNLVLDSYYESEIVNYMQDDYPDESGDAGHYTLTASIPSDILQAQQRITALEAEVKRLREAFNRQADNMAFVVNYVSMPDRWYEKLRVELDEDRTATTDKEGR